MIPNDLAKWITEIGAEVRLRTNNKDLQARSQRIEDLLKIIAEREVTTAQAKGVSQR